MSGRNTRKRFNNALKLAGGVSASFLLFSPGKVWSQCITTPPDALTVTGACTESEATRSTTAGGQNVVSVSAGGVYKADNMTITSAGNNAFGVTMTGSQSITELKNSTVTTQGEFAYGVRAQDGSRLTIENLDVKTHGYASDALLVQGAGTTVKFDGVNLLTTGGSARGIRVMEGAVVEGSNAIIRTQPADHDDGTDESLRSDAIIVENNAKLSLTDSTISTEGAMASGIDTFKEGEFYGNRLHISTSGTDAWGGVVTDSGSKLTLMQSTITTTGAGPSRGLYAKESGSLVLDQVDLSTRGAGAYGIEAKTSARVEARNLRIETQGAEASGTIISDEGTTVSFDSGVIRTSGATAHGVHVKDGGTFSATNVQVSAEGAGASAIALTRPSTSNVAAITINGGRLSATEGALIRVDGGHGAITLNGPTELTPGVVDGTPVLASITDLGGGQAADIELNFNGVSGITGKLITTGSNNQVSTALRSSEWKGDLQVDGDNTVQVTLADSQWSGQSLGATGITVDQASTWNVTDSSTAGTVSNAGLVQFSPSSPGFSTLSVRDYQGQNGSIGINTVLGADNSPSNRLIIDGGSVTGQTGVSVANAGGTGALTTGDGIHVVETLNGGNTHEGAFHLSNRVAAGAYEYLLFRGGSSSAEDWFLRSHLIELKNEPQTPDPVVPLYRPEVPLYMPAPAMARQMGLSFLGTLHERVGEQMNIRSQVDQKSHFNGAWARAIGEFGHSKWSGTTKTRARGASIVGIQMGLDIYRAEHANGYRDHAGIYGGYVQHKAKIRGFALGVNDLQVGKLTLDGPAVGAYWTRYSPTGTYLDGVLQWNWFDVTAKSNYGTRLDTKGTGFAASLEAGRPFAIAEGWQLEPQAQLIYQNTSVRKGSDAFSTVKWREGDAVTGRLGARLQFTSEQGDTLWQPYAKANVWHGFSGKDRTVFGASSMDTQFGNTALELGAGITAKVSKTVSLYAHLDHRWAVSGRERGSFTGGALGVRINW